MKDFARTLFGIRKKRRALPTGPGPQVGATIVRGSVKMTVTEPVAQELWDWLLLSGWRANNVRNDRRTYVSLPGNAFGQLMAAGTEKRETVHAQLLSAARSSSSAQK